MTNGNLCPNGHPNLESAKFCIECGALVTIANGAGSAQEASSHNDPSQNDGSSKKRFVIVGSIVGGLIVLVGIAAAIAGLGLFSGSGGNYGAVGTVVIQPIFDDAQEFSDNGLAPARVGEQWGM